MTTTPTQTDKNTFYFEDIFSKSWEIFKKHFSYVFGLSVISLALIAAAHFGFYAEFLTQLETPETLNISRFIIPGIISLLLLLVFGVYYMSILNVLTYNEIQDKSFQLSDGIGQANKRFITIIMAAILSSLAILGGTLLLIIPGIIIGIQLAFINNIAVLSNKSATECFHHSRNLVKNRWWKTIGYSLLVMIIITIAQVAIIIPLYLLFAYDAFMDVASAPLWITGVETFLSYIAGAFQVIFMVVMMYFYEKYPVALND